VTLLGPGGVGKTRLALAIASAVKPDEFDTARFVDLTAVSQPRLVLDAIGAALGVHAQGTASILDLLIERFRDRRILLVLDNFEHLSDAAPDLARLLAGCPGMTALVTSRSALRIRGEHEVSLAPLDVPPANEPVDVTAIGRSAAVSLFVQSARGVRPDFTLDRQNAAAIADLCRRLDGVPLAIELAAAQLRVLTPVALLGRLGERLDRSLDLTTATMDLPARQHTLRATLEWSYSLLDEVDRALLAQLSVFAGSWTAQGAQVVGGLDEDAVLGTLSSLAAQSLVSVQYHDGSEPRFTMLDTVRVYASERLRERGEEQACLARLDQYLRGFVASAGPELQGPENREWADRVGGELNDLRRAMSRAVAADDPATVIALTAPLFVYWWSHGLLGEMRQLAEVASELPSAAQLPPEAATSLQWARGMFQVSVGQNDQAQPLLRRVLDATNTTADPRLHAHALAGLGIASAITNVTEAKQLLDDALGAFRAVDDRWGLAYALSARGQLALLDGDPASAAKLHHEGLTAADDIANDHLRAQLLDQLGLDALTSGDVTGARRYFGRAAGVHAELLDQEGSAYCLDGFAAIALAHQRPDIAARLLGASTHARDLVGVAVRPALKPLEDGLHSTVAAALGDADFAQATALGAQMRLNEALAYALAATSPEPAPDPT
jgi:predicted ATPase